MDTNEKSHEITYVPFGESQEITLNRSHVEKFIQVRTKSGASASPEDIVKFIMLCKAQMLNPWVRDAYLVGYDGHDGPTFSLIVAYQALAKRAEANDAYDGIDAGVIVEFDGEIIDRVGAFAHPGDNLVGAWAKCYRKDRSHPFEVRIKRESYDKRRSRWKDDPEGMLVKVARAASLREAFPTVVGGLYVEEELGAIEGTARLVSSAAVADVDKQMEADAPERKVMSEMEKVDVAAAEYAHSEEPVLEPSIEGETHEPDGTY